MLLGASFITQKRVDVLKQYDLYGYGLFVNTII